MCLIIAKKAGVPHTPEIYKSVAASYNLRNQDGFGFALKRGGRIYMSKGYFNLGEFIKKLKFYKPRTEDELMVHLRKVSAGDKNEENCHPYVCSTMDEVINTLEGYVKLPVVSHNGTFQNYIKYNTMSKNSDTFNFVKELLGEKDMPEIVHKLVQMKQENLIMRHNSSRLCIMHPGKIPMTIIGDWITEKSGILYSNDSYKGKFYSVRNHHGGMTRTHHSHTPSTYSHAGRGARMDGKLFDDSRWARMSAMD